MTQNTMWAYMAFCQHQINLDNKFQAKAYISNPHPILAQFQHTLSTQTIHVKMKDLDLKFF
jgi:hypothetical protein